MKSNKERREGGKASTSFLHLPGMRGVTILEDETSIEIGDLRAGGVGAEHRSVTETIADSTGLVVLTVGGVTLSVSGVLRSGA